MPFALDSQRPPLLRPLGRTSGRASSRLRPAAALLTLAVVAMLQACGGSSNTSTAADPAQPDTSPQAVALAADMASRLPLSKDAGADAMQFVLPKGATTLAYDGQAKGASTKAADPSQSADSSGPLGANLSPIYDWSRTHEFVDLLRQARPFGPADTPWSSTVPVGADGWPTQDFGVILMSNQYATKGLGGVYTIRFSGQATVKLLASPGSLSAPRVDAATGITTIDYTFPEGGDQMILSFKNTNGSVKDLQIIRPGYDAAQPPTFTRHFLDHVARFNVLRFMEWQLINANPLQHWSDRPTPVNTRTTSAQHLGVPLETIIALANSTKKDIWLNIPQGASDDYVRQMATLLRDQLDPTVRVYFEFSNELWNMMFKQTRDNQAAAEAEVRANPQSFLAIGGETSPYRWAARRVAKRTIEIGAMFEQVFGAGSLNTRVRPVLASQIQGQWQYQTMLEMVAAAYPKDVKDYFYAVAGAPYVSLYASPHGGQDLRNTEGLTRQQVLDTLATVAAGELSYRYTNMEVMAFMSKLYGLRMFAYEGGVDTFGPTSIAAKREANFDPQIREICRTMLGNWATAGGDTFMYFHAGAMNYRSQYGAFALTEDMQDYSHKLKCVDEHLAAKAPTPLSRHQAPIVFSAKETVGRDNTVNATLYYKAGQTNPYLISVPEDGTWTISVESGIAPAQMDVLVDGRVAGRLNLQRTAPMDWWPYWSTNLPPTASSNALPVQLKAGVHAMHLVFRTHGVNTWVPRISVQRQ